MASIMLGEDCKRKLRNEMPTQCGIQWLTFISCFKAWDRRLCFEKFMVHMWEENNLAYSNPAAQQDV